MKVIPDSSVLISLASIGKLDLIPELFSTAKVIIPEAVHQEVVEEGKGRQGAEEVRVADWISSREVSEQRQIKLLKAHLDSGEAEVIALADKLNADLLLLDEKEAREVARELGLRVLGTVGILIKAKKESIIDSLQKELDHLKNDANFRISQALYQKALAEVSEGH